ncbi:MAG: UxaA family hydrolase [Bacillota bacterium]
MEISLAVMNPNDNVATAVRDISANETVKDDNGQEITVIDPIPFGHKAAISKIPAGAEVIKYGEPIGIAVTEIKVGCHVHVHNVEGARGRGDKRG